MEKLKLNIQLFAEDEAANEEEETLTDGTDAGTETEDTSVDKTKAFSERLKAKTMDIEKKAEETYNNKLNAIAQQQGYETWEEFEKASHSQALRDIGVDEENEEKFQKLIDNAIDKNPDVVKAREIVRKSEEEKKQVELNNEVQLIHSIDESINTIDDIAKLDNVQEIINLLNKGYRLYDAYRLVNYDSILVNNSDDAKKRAVDDINSKSHMKTSQGGSGTSTYVPQDVYAMYKRNMPKWTDEQIRSHYAKSMKEG